MESDDKHHLSRHPRKVVSIGMNEGSEQLKELFNIWGNVLTHFVAKRWM